VAPSLSGRPIETPTRTSQPADAVTIARGKHPHVRSGQEPVGGEPPHRLRARLAWRPWYVLPVAVAVVIVSGLVSGPSDFPADLRVQVGQWSERVFNTVLEDGAWLYEPIATLLETAYDSLVACLELISPPVLVAAVVLLVGYFKGVRLGLLALALFAWVTLTGLWETTVDTVAFMVVAVVVSSIIGIAVGLFAATNGRVHAAVSALLDAMQAFPAFAYLVPVVFLFGVGNTTALFVTVIWAMPPIARMTSVGLRNVSSEVVEAAVAAGASRRQLLRDVRFPLAATSIRAGLNQTIMYAIAMAVLAAMIGAEGLGAPVWSGLRRLEFGQALEAGIALVLVAILIDRVSPARAVRSSRGQVSRGPRGRLLRKPSPAALTAFAVFFGVLAATELFRGPWLNLGDPPWGTPLELKDPVRDFVFWVTTDLGPGLEAVATAIQQVAFNRLGEFYTSIPWFVVVLCTAVVGTVVVGRLQGVVMGLGVAAIGWLGMWAPTAETLAVVSTAIALALVIGFPLGVLMSASAAAAAVMRPILDVMQTLPVYLFVIPAVLFFGSGEVSAVLATLLAAVPPVIRYTNTALRGADAEVVEAATAFGATRWQVLRQVRIPIGLPTLMVGLNQAVLIALAMAVVSAMIGAPGLGQEILVAIQRIDLPRGIEAGLAMFLLAVILDRLFNGSVRMLRVAEHLTPTTHTSADNGKAAP
jgi:glycine betaine/proline transport system permease protein